MENLCKKILKMNKKPILDEDLLSKENSNFNQKSMNIISLIIVVVLVLFLVFIIISLDNSDPFEFNNSEPFND